MKRYKILILGLGFFGEYWVKALEGLNNCILTGEADSIEDIKKLLRKSVCLD